MRKDGSNMKEVWADIEGYEGLYQVSNYGRVRSIHIMKPRIHKGYCNVNLRKGYEMKSYRVHRLVANAFIDNPENKPEVNHIDAVKHNNNVSNLEWVTAKENMKHAEDNHLIKHIGNPNKTAIKIIMDDEKVFDSITKCAKYLGVDKSDIRKVLKGKQYTVHGHTFKYFE